MSSPFAMEFVDSPPACMRPACVQAPFQPEAPIQGFHARGMNRD
ncbi:MAG TPA: hypothetical protein P5572_11450 [Phycisphaerae bacterium]|nr:hypothetical protein [Phycisphaerae bacterium]